MTPEGGTITLKGEEGPLVSYKLIKWHIAAAGISILISMTAGFLYSLQFLGYYPFPDSEALSPGHLRLIHTNMAAYGWLVNGFTAISYYAIPRLTGFRVASEKLGVVIFWAWQLTLVLMMGGRGPNNGPALEWGATLPARFRLPAGSAQLLGLVMRRGYE